MDRRVPLAQIQSEISNGRMTCAGLVDTCLQRIEEHASLNAFLEVYGDEARLRAAEIDRKAQSGKAGKLHGLVISIKDVLCYGGHKVSAASKILEGFTSLYSATAVERLIREDAIIIGRTNCDEFAMGTTSENSAYGPVINYIGRNKVPGGSSGGAAVSVQAGMCHAALGTDTGGSVRQPAAFCGVVGFKPTYGRISRHGLIAYASSFDQVGIFANYVQDIAVILEVVAGIDDYDATAADADVPQYSKLLSFTGKAKIAYPETVFSLSGIDEGISDKLREAIRRLKELGHSVSPVQMPLLDYLVPTYYVLTTAEASSNLARYDGIRYGYSVSGTADVEELHRKSRSKGFGKEVKRRIMLGTFVLSEGYYDAYYSKAQKVRRMITDFTNSVLSKHDFILLPTTPVPAFDIGEMLDPVSLYLQDIFTVQANLAGVPAISMPFGDHASGMPVGMQLIAGRFREDKLLAFSSYIADIIAQEHKPV